MKLFGWNFVHRFLLILFCIVEFSIIEGKEFHQKYLNADLDSDVYGVLFDSPKVDSGKSEGEIDEFLSILLSNPNDYETRFKLISALVKESRFEEAKLHLQYLELNYSETARFQRLKRNIAEQLGDPGDDEIKKYELLLDSGPLDLDVGNYLTDLYINAGSTEKARELSDRLYSSFPLNRDLHFLFIRSLISNQNYEEAVEELKKASESEPDDPRILEYLTKIVLYGTGNEALDNSAFEMLTDYNPSGEMKTKTGIANDIRTNKFNEAKDKINDIELDDKDLPVFLALYSENYKTSDELYADRLENARNLKSSGDCVNAEMEYVKAFEMNPPDSQLKLEFAEVLECNGKFNEAIDLYNEIIERQYSPEVDKMRAIAYYKAGDRFRAFDEFLRLSEKFPNDAELKVYVGDSYRHFGQYEKAKSVYNFAQENLGSSEAFDKNAKTPSYKYARRSSEFEWIFNDRPLHNSFYDIRPYARIYSDNQSCDNKYGGINLRIGWLKFLWGGINLRRGSFNATNAGFNYSSVEGNIYIKLWEPVDMYFGLGQIFFPLSNSKSLLSAGLKYNGNNRYHLNFSFIQSDAIDIFDSGLLLQNRLVARRFRGEGNLSYDSGLSFYTIYNYYQVDNSTFIENNTLRVARENFGNDFLVGLGFKSRYEFELGYEFEYADFQDTYNIYYTPQEIDGHNLWLGWEAAKGYKLDPTSGILVDVYFKILIGYIPEYDFLKRGISGEIEAKYLAELGLKITGEYEFTRRFIENYQSFQLNAALFYSFH